MAKLEFTLLCTLLYASQLGSGSSIRSYSNASCHKLSKNTLSFLSTKTPYIYKGDNWQHIPEGCTAKKIWYFGRHGTRNPGDSEILYMQNELPMLANDILENYEENRGSLCEEEINMLKLWRPHEGLNVKEEKYLVERGKAELSGIATRYKARFPDLFPEVFSNQSYFFKFTKSQRTEASAHAFARGLFGSEGASDVWYPKAKKADPVLKFYENCRKWKVEVDKNPEAYAEKTLFENSTLMLATLSKVSQRLGFLRNLTLDEVGMIYITCSFETAWAGGTVVSPWCVSFDEEDFKAMNFREDLEYYWIDSYGHEINYEQACPPIKDVVEFFDQLDSTRKVTAYFTHSGASLKVLARLGLYMDNYPLTVSRYDTQKEERKWNTSYIGTMASNMAFVLYNCPNKEQNEQIGYYFQEKPTRLIACGDKWLCPYEEFKGYYTDIINTCNLDEICHKEDENNSTSLDNEKNWLLNSSSKVGVPSSFNFVYFSVMLALFKLHENIFC